MLGTAMVPIAVCIAGKDIVERMKCRCPVEITRLGWIEQHEPSSSS